MRHLHRHAVELLLQVLADPLVVLVPILKERIIKSGHGRAIHIDQRRDWQEEGPATEWKPAKEGA